MLKNWILRLTHRLWNREISRILGRAYSDRVINSQQLHELTAAFDPTQRHMVHGEHRDAGFREPGSEPMGVAEFLAEFESDGGINWAAAKQAAVKRSTDQIHRNLLQSLSTSEQKPGKDTK